MGLTDDELARAARDAERRWLAENEYRRAVTDGTKVDRPYFPPPDMDGPAPAPSSPSRWDDVDVLRRRWAGRYPGADLPAEHVVAAVARHAVAKDRKHAKARKHSNRWQFAAGEFTEPELIEALRGELDLTMRGTGAYFGGLVREVAQGMAGLDRLQEWSAHHWLEYRIFRPTGGEMHTTAYRASAEFLAAKVDLDEHWRAWAEAEPSSELPPVVRTDELLLPPGDEFERSAWARLAEGDDASHELVASLGVAAHDFHTATADAFGRAAERIDAMPPAERSAATQRVELIREAWEARLLAEEAARHRRRVRDSRPLRGAWLTYEPKDANLPANLPEQTVEDLLDGP